MSFYKLPIDHLYDEIRWITHVIYERLHAFRSQRLSHFAGLLIEDQTISDILNSFCLQENWQNKSEINNPNCDTLRSQIDIKIQKTEEAGFELPLQKIVKVYSLSHYEKAVLLITLLPEIDCRFEKIISWAADDISKKCATIALVQDILCDSFNDKCRNYQSFFSYSPLIKNYLIHIQDETDLYLPNQTRMLRLDKRVYTFLISVSCVDEKIRSLIKIPEKINILTENLICSEYFKQEIEHVFLKVQTTQSKKILFFSGMDDSEKYETALLIAARLERKIMFVSTDKLIRDRANFRENVNRIFREAMFQNLVVYFENVNILTIPEHRVELETFLELQHDFNHLIILDVQSYRELTWNINAPFLNLSFEFPTSKHRQQIWNKYLHKAGYKASVNNFISEQFKFNSKQIRSAVIEISQQLSPSCKSVELVSVAQKICREISSKNLEKYSMKLQTPHTWDDLVLPKERLNQLLELSSSIRYREKVLYEWGFSNKLPLGKGIAVLFSGPSGTGKTMAASIISNELGIDIYRIDLSIIVSKYVGETEKNLATIFDEASTSNALLFFDEADALFGKRSEVKDAHDRYANIEISYLLQKIEEYEGIVILATNFRQNIDTAFLRRMTHIIEFPFPDETLRKEIWKVIFPPNAPLSTDIDFSFLAQSIKLSGGHIKNIAVGAAFMAASENSSIDMRHIIRAVKREYEKLGMSFLKSDMRNYFDLGEPVYSNSTMELIS